MIYHLNRCGALPINLERLVTCKSAHRCYCGSPESIERRATLARFKRSNVGHVFGSPHFLYPLIMRTLTSSIVSYTMMSLDTAIDALTKDLENGGYFHQVSPKDFGAEGFFKGFDDQRRARAVWTTSVIPRLISSKHPTLQRAGLGLQGKWNSQAYRKQLSRALEQEVIVLDSVRKHQTEILNHSYEDLCHTLKRRKASFRESEDTTGQYDPTEISHAATGTLDKSSSTTGEQTGDDPSSSNSVSDTDRCNSPVAGTSDVGGPVCEVEEDSDEVDQDIGDKDDLSLAPFTDEDRKALAEKYLKL
ncbi:hypothetical protein EDD21DRAFT_184337 [Dissophora ornata]|nr:hypothetical protein EDD21DRAFT_184337 [Dissophora ornata]